MRSEAQNPRPGAGQVWHGRFSDGNTAGSHVVEVQLTERGVAITQPGNADTLIWPYGALGVATPVSPKARDVLVTYSHMPGATLFVADPAFVRPLTGAAPQLTASAYGWRSARPWIVVAAVLALIAATVHFSNLSPARWVAGLMPDHLRKSLGEKVMAAVAQNKRTCDAPAGRAALDRLVTRLSKSSRSSRRFEVRVLDWGLVNAFAAPGEQIVLTRAIIMGARSPDEVAGVLAHEMGHGIGLHPEAGIVRVLGLTAALELLMGGGGGALANIGVLLTQFSYSRVAEREADDLGLELLQGAQISPSGLAGFFQRIGTLETKQGNRTTFSMLRTHPDPAERARRASQRPAYPSTPAMSEADWQALRAICKAG